ncbi:MAG: phosphogluconate dehydratase [Rhodobiaceae bacterium]|nr:phosphogluconate dehydratase [Rhodobiaceae bacterium]
MHPVLQEITARITARSAATRQTYLDGVAAARDLPKGRDTLSAGNQAHAFAACPAHDKQALLGGDWPNIAIISAYNDMLSAHQPYHRYPDLIREAARDCNATAQFAGGVPAMCDGVTQGQPGMELSLFSRDVIAMSTAIALSHNSFDAGLYLGICDKIVPGLLIGALQFGHLPAIFVPSGPMASGLPNGEKARIRNLYAEGKASREELLKAECDSYHSAGTCTFYGTANSNQMLMEFMGLHMPGAAFIPPDSELRDELTRAATTRAAALSSFGSAPSALADIVDEKSIINGMIGLLATGGSTNHTLHLPAIARAAGVLIDWKDFDDLSKIIPLLAKVYPNGQADVNHFHAAGGIGFVIGSLLDSGLLHDDVQTVFGRGLSAYRLEPVLENHKLVWRNGPENSGDSDILTDCNNAFDAEGGIRLLDGNLGRAIIKVSAVNASHRIVEAPARIFHDQNDVQEAFEAGNLEADAVIVLRFQGPAANGMPELHKLTPALTVLQERGFKVALVTDGRMSGASGKVPAAIHVTPEAAQGGPLASLRDGDMIRLDSESGELNCAADLSARPLVKADIKNLAPGLGRNLFGLLKKQVSSAEEGASLVAFEEG